MDKPLNPVISKNEFTVRYQFWCDACTAHYHSTHIEAGNSCQVCGADGTLYVWMMKEPVARR